MAIITVKELIKALKQYEEYDILIPYDMGSYTYIGNIGVHSFIKAGAMAYKKDNDNQDSQDREGNQKALILDI